ncbi:MAG TPA: DNA replication/repair protein RecF [Actinomycetota bacterium]|nr:DNA replication/repair protein RecF [Actinomycetota bacterium]
MEVGELDLVDFRNYESARVEFVTGLNLVEGRNGQGKTNLLEAVHTLSGLGSHRTSTLAPLVRHGAEFAVIRSRGKVKGRSVSVDAQIPRTGGIRLLVNKVAASRSPANDALVSCVLFSPEDLALVKGGPEERRRFMDQAASRMRPLATTERQEFERALKQRNGVLKAASFSSRAAGQLDVWTEQLVKSGSVVVRNRLRVLEAIAAKVTGHYTEVSGTGEGPALVYESSWIRPEDDDIEARLRAALEAAQPREIERGVSLVGPHRDDLLISLGAADARTFSSQGEQRSLALALRLAERDLVSEARGESPVLLLDDVFSELDEQRRARLGELVLSSGQTIATATSAADLPLEPQRSIKIEAGKVMR